MSWPRIENPWVTGPGPWDSPEPKALETCGCCECELFHGDKVFKIGCVYYCENCVEEDYLEAEEYETEDPRDEDYYREERMWEQW